MFKWLNKPIGKSKQRPEQQPEQQASQKSVEVKQKTKQLLGRESTGAVMQEDTRQQGPSDALRSLLKTAIADAEQIVDSIEMRAQAEAKAEAARIIAQANLEIQEIKGKAEIAAQKQAEEILSAANKMAEITEAEAKQRTLQFLVRVEDEVEKEIGEEYKRVYSRLSTHLQDLINEGQNIEKELKDKTAKLWEGKRLELKEYEATLLGTSEVAVPPIETSASAETEEKVAEPVQLQEEAEPAAKEEVTEEKVAEPVQLQEEAEVTAEEEVAEEKVEEPVQLQEEADITAKGAEAAMEEPLEQQVTQTTLDSQALYAGEVEFIVASPVELKLVSRLYNYLQTVPELRILYTRGSWDQGTTITVVLEKPMPLISILAKTPEVKVVPALLEKGNQVLSKSSSLFRGEEKDLKRIQLNLKEPQSL